MWSLCGREEKCLNAKFTSGTDIDALREALSKQSETTSSIDIGKKADEGKKDAETVA